MLRACVIDFGVGWSKYLSLVEFAYNNSYQASIDMAPYEALYGRKCRSPVCWYGVGERRLMGPELIQITSDKIKVIRDKLQTSSVGKKGKLSPRFIRPFEILERVGVVAYRLALPPNLSSIHPVFHVSMLRKYLSDSSHVLEVQPVELREDM
jgi:hypothetical protein